MAKDEINQVQSERGSVYGDFSDHAEDVEKIMAILSMHNAKKNNGVVCFPKGFKTAIFYIVSKLVRLVASPEHEDTALDLSSYSNLWLKIIRKVKNETGSND